jgi:hypothetical protein
MPPLTQTQAQFIKKYLKVDVAASTSPPEHNETRDLVRDVVKTWVKTKSNLASNVAAMAAAIKAYSEGPEAKRAEQSLKQIWTKLDGDMTAILSDAYRAAQSGQPLTLAMPKVTDLQVRLQNSKQIKMLRNSPFDVNVDFQGQVTPVLTALTELAAR